MDKQLDLFLGSLCMSGGKTTIKFIEGYSEYAESVLKSYGFIETLDEGVYKEIKITDKGTDFYRKGGFKGDKERLSNTKYDRALDNKSKKIGLIIAVSTLIVSILSLVATIISDYRRVTITNEVI